MAINPPDYMAKLMEEKDAMAKADARDLEMVKSDLHLRKQLSDMLGDYFPPTIKDYEVWDDKGFTVGFSVAGVEFTCAVYDNWSGTRAVFIRHPRLWNFIFFKAIFTRRRVIYSGWITAATLAEVYRETERAKDWKRRRNINRSLGN